MKHDIGATITRALSPKDVSRAGNFNYVAVYDLRRGKSGQPAPVDECLLKRFRNLQVPYEQRPLDLRRASCRDLNDLMRAVLEHWGSVLLITDDAASAIRFCADFKIPFRNLADTVQPTQSEPVKVPAVLHEGPVGGRPHQGAGQVVQLKAGLSRNWRKSA
jgi:hypothetical protein